MRRKVEGHLRIVQPESLARTWLVGDRKIWSGNQIPIRVQVERKNRRYAKALTDIVVRANAEARVPFKRQLNEIFSSGSG